MRHWIVITPLTSRFSAQASIVEGGNDDSPLENDDNTADEAAPTGTPTE